MSADLEHLLIYICCPLVTHKTTATYIHIAHVGSPYFQVQELKLNFDQYLSHFHSKWNKDFEKYLRIKPLTNFFLNFKDFVIMVHLYHESSAALQATCNKIYFGSRCLHVGFHFQTVAQILHSVFTAVLDNYK